MWQRSRSGVRAAALGAGFWLCPTEGRVFGACVRGWLR